MVRTIIAPNDVNVNLAIPANYVGKKIEVTFFPVDELIEEKPVEKKWLPLEELFLRKKLMNSRNTLKDQEKNGIGILDY